MTGRKALVKLRCIHYPAIEVARVLGRAKRGRIAVRTLDGRRHFVKSRDVELLKGTNTSEAGR